MALAPKMPVALQILIHTPGRLAVSLGGILLAVMLMFSQIGFRDGMFDSQAELINELNGDFFILNKLKHIMYDANTFPSRRIYQALAVPGVRAVRPLYMEIAVSNWRNPVTRKRRRIRVLAFNPADAVFRFPAVAAHADALKMPNTVLFDQKSRDCYGNPKPGTRTELANREVTVVGTFELGTDFLTDGNVIMSDRNFEMFFPDLSSRKPHLGRVAVGVVKVDPAFDSEAVGKALSATLPEDVIVLSKDELMEREKNFWHKNTAIGQIFMVGMVVALIVGIIICYQVLYTNVNNYLPQFATLKAIGFSDMYLIGVVLQQAVFLSVLGFLPALVGARILFWYVSSNTGLLMRLTPTRGVSVLLLTLAMCLFSGALAMRRVLTADPAEVFK
jgi:putative ABC transport system permease protein